MKTFKKRVSINSFDLIQSKIDFPPTIVII